MASYFRYYIIILFILVANNGFSQNECNCELFNKEKEISKINRFDSIKVYSKIKNLNNSESISCKLISLDIEFDFLYNRKDIQKSLENITLQEILIEDLQCDNEFLYDFYLNKTFYYKLINDFESLSVYAFMALKEAEKLQNVEKEIEVIKQIVFLFTRMKENSKRWSYFKRAEKLILKTGYNKENISNYIWLAFEIENEYTKTERKSLIDSAMVYAKKSKKIAIEYQMYSEIANSYRALEAFSYHKGELENALMYIDSAIYYAKKIKRKKNLTGFYISKSWDHHDLGQFEEASKWMDTALYLDRKKQDIGGYMMLLSTAAEIYEGSGKLDKAYSSFKLHNKLKDSVMSEQRSKVINELETKYQTELKDNKIKQLTTLLIATSLGIVTLLLITTILRLRQSRKQNKALRIAFDKQIQLEKELSDVRDEIAQDFHDDLGNKLARISLLSNLVSGEVSIDDPKVKSKIKQITEDANGLYKGTRDFVFSLKSNSDYIEEITTYLSDFGEDYFSKTNIKFIVEKSISSNDKLPHYWNKQLVFIFKEALTNTLKHSQCDTVKLKFTYENKQLNITCEDNGVGIPSEDLNSSNGLKNMKSRALKIDGLLNINSTLGKGTIISFTGNTNHK